MQGSRVHLLTSEAGIHAVYVVPKKGFCATSDLKIHHQMPDVECYPAADNQSIGHISTGCQVMGFVFHRASALRSQYLQGMWIRAGVRRNCK